MRLGVIGVLSVLLLCAPVAVAQAAEWVVTVRAFEFSPAELTIQKGDLVRWEWEAGAHTLTDGDPENPGQVGTRFQVPLNAQNREFEFVFTEPGTVSYFSGLDPDVRGSITLLSGTPVNQRTWGWLKQVFENPAAARNRR